MFVRAAPDQSGGEGPVGLFLLDTGAQATVIDLRLAAQARLHLGRGVDLNAPAGDVAARRTGGLELRLEGGPSARVEATVADLSDTARVMGLPLAGVLGMDFLARFVLVLDYRSGAVRLSPGDPTTNAASTPMRVAPLPFVGARVERGRRSAQGDFQIDTGSNTAIEFWAPFAARAFPGARGAPGESIGLGGVEATDRGRIDVLEIADRRIEGLTANFADEGHPDGAGPNYAGVIGGPAWAGRVLTLDFPGCRIALS